LAIKPRWGRRGRSAAASDERKPAKIYRRERDGFLAIEIYDIAGERRANQLSEAAVSGSEAANAGIDLKNGSHGETSDKGSGRLQGMKAVITGGDSDSGIGRAAPIPTPARARTS